MQGVQTVSISVNDMTLDELEQLSQGIARQIEHLQGQRRYLAGKIAERLQRGERTGGALDPAQAASHAMARAARRDALAPGAVIAAEARG